MNDTPENPPAFPTKLPALDPRESGFHTVEGMTLRDYFAAKALPQLVAEWSDYHEEIASEAYKIADAMLRARKEAK